MPDYELLREQGTTGMNYDLDTEDIIARLQQWQDECDFELADVENDRFTVYFQTLPDDLDTFAKELQGFCPDLISQHFGCFEEMLDAYEDMGEEVPREFAELIEGVDLKKKDYGLEILKRALLRDKEIHLWWD
jgi:hypothetical protein